MTAFRTRSRRAILLWIVAILGLVGYSFGYEGTAIHWKVQRQPSRIVNGSPFLIEAHTSRKLKSLSATWLNHDVHFAWEDSGKYWYGLAGTSLSTAPGTYQFEFSGELADGRKVSFSQRIAVRRAKYPNANVTVDQKFTEPSSAELQEIHKDKETKQEVFAQFTPTREWVGDFQQPVVARISDVFGATRTFNGKVQSTHEGLDFAVPTGTAILALNRGRVVLARPLFFEGNCVMIDHGQGLLSLYLHLSQINVKEGDQVSRGQEIGLSGGTGRATGPHLHVAVRWQGVYVNPATLFSLKIPQGN